MMLGLFSSAGSWMRRYSVVICTDGSPANGATSSSIAPGSISGSSPCTLTTTSQSSEAATSARRSVPVSCVAFVSRTLPPNSLTRVAMRRSSVATMTSETTRASRDAPVDVLDHRTAVEVGERLAGEPRRSESGGDDGDDGERRNRIDLGPVDAGCTTNNSTPLGARRAVHIYRTRISSARAT